MLYDSREYKKICNSLATYVTVAPNKIPMMRNGEPLTFDDCLIHESVARLKGGIPNPKIRPYVEPPCEIEFTLYYIKNNMVSQNQVKDIFIKGGLHVGLGTFRPIFGKFEVVGWDEIE